jgi:hypothetical protein
MLETRRLDSTSLGMLGDDETRRLDSTSLGMLGDDGSHVAAPAKEQLDELERATDKSLHR